MRRFDLGIASYGRNWQQLEKTFASIIANSVTDFRVFVVHNPSEGDELTKEAICRIADRDSRFVPVWHPTNTGYAGAVNTIMESAATRYVGYCDNDVIIDTPGWDERFAKLLDSHEEVAQVFPGSGHYGFHNGQYDECLWNAGYCWMLRKSAISQVKLRDLSYGTCNGSGLMDVSLGHHEEVDLMIRLRLAGYQIACCPDVNVRHMEAGTNANPDDHKPGGRIHDGVVRWQNKWNRYFCGDQLKYSMTAYDPRMLRYTDWPPCALYLERMVLHHFPQHNANPRIVQIPGVGEMDAIEVLKPTNCYRGRAI